MNFFESQAQARASSRRLTLLFLLAVLTVVGTVDLLVIGMDAYYLHDSSEPLTGPEFRNIVVVTSLITLFIVVIGSFWRTSQVAGGGGAVARSAGGVPVSSETTNPRLRRLRNVVEEIAIASGVPVPEIYVLEQEAGINAFAAGFTPANAAIAVTRGALEKLNRDELQGVIAHEFSHVLNGDMRLNLRLMGLVFGLLMIHVIGRGIGDMISSKRDRDDRWGKDDPRVPIMVFAIGLMAVGYIGVFLGRMIKAAVSRQRETLADASAVQFTRQTSGIAGALKKIAGLDAGSKLKTNAEEVSHMLFGEGLSLSSLFATHPPIEQRIKALEPSFQLRQIEAKRAEWNSESFAADDDPGPSLQAFDASARLAVAAPSTLRVGEPAPADIAHAELLHQSLPEELLAAARGDNAAALVMALLVQPDGPAAGRQLASIESAHGAAMREQVERLIPPVQGLHPAHRLPLASVALPSLRRWPRDRLLTLMRTITFLIQADGEVGVFEYCLSRLLRQQLQEVLSPRSARAFGNKTIPDCRRQVQVLLSVVAQQGHADGGAARAAYLRGLGVVLPQAPLPFEPIERWTVALDHALGDLDQLKPQATAPLIEALLATINHDNRLTVAEAELLRVICAGLHCPLPALLGS